MDDDAPLLRAERAADAADRAATVALDAARAARRTHRWIGAACVAQGINCVWQIYVLLGT